MKTKQHILIKTILLVFFSYLLVGCNDDYLDTEPKTTVPESEAYSSADKIKAQVNNLYKQLQNQSLYGGRFIIFNEQRADEFAQNDGNAAAGSAVWNNNVASTNEFVNNVWSVAYTAINASNKLIENLNATKLITDAEVKNYIAEAKFVRALCYFSLLQTYAKPYNLDKNALGVPLRLTGITTAGNNNIARSTVEEVYSQIITDLNAAEVDLPIHYGTNLLNTSRAKKSTAIALKTRVFLNKNDFENVSIEAAKLVSENAPFQYVSGALLHRLESTIANVFTGSYVGSEAIFSIPFANTTQETPSAQSSLAFNYVKQPIIPLAATGIVSNAVFSSQTDARTGLIGVSAANQKVLKKFAISTAPFRDYVPVIRYAEVLLNYAEAEANLNNSSKAIALLQAVRNRSDASYEFPESAINTKEALLQTIATERRIEFLGEGFRLLDLQRNLQTIPAKSGSIGTAPIVLITASNYIWPIPSGEISTNNLMVPN